MKTIFILLFLSVQLVSCQENSNMEVNKVQPDTSAAKSSSDVEQNKEEPWINTNGKNIKERILIPEGYSRISLKSGSFHEYLLNYPLKSHGSAVTYFDGSKKVNRNVYCAVFDQEIGNKDLHQCADAVMNLKASYHFLKKEYDKIHFNFTSGDRADFKKYAEGYRASIKGSKVSWIKKAERDYSEKTFRNYMNLIYSYCGTASLAKEMDPIDLKEILPGDVFILGGHPGHAVIVLDVILNEAGEKGFLLAQSYMPAQQTQVLINPKSNNQSPWYFVKDLKDGLETPEWSFELNQLKRFKD
ncbi:MAG: DUF4846 domain-containing protein [Crocinitomicaceae bacterium]|nr:DUF4846 domain-containing protein [Crocinitomicaceae bacterium]